MRMDRPEWVPAPAWARLGPALGGQPAHALDALVDLEAATRCWDAAPRARLLERFSARAEAGVPLPAAFILALSDLMDAAHE